LTAHLEDVLSEDGFIIHQDLASAQEIMNLRLITAGIPYPQREGWEAAEGTPDT
jgi:hypothetical protein